MTNQVARRLAVAMMILSCSFILAGCGGKMSVEEFEKKKAQQGTSTPLPGESISLDSFTYEFGNIMVTTKHRVDIRLLDGKYWYSTNSLPYVKLSREQQDKFFEMIDKYKLYSTKENRTGYFEDDGFDFSIEYELTDGTKAFDSSQVVAIEGGYTLMDEFDSLFSMGYHVK